MRGSDKAYYDRTADDFDESALRGMISIQRKYFATYEKRLRRHFDSGAGINVIELGAGTGILSLLVKATLPEATMTALDISLPKMRTTVPKAAALLGQDAGVLRLEEGDFSRLRQKPPASAHLILFDAAMHHARSMWDLLADCRRVISDRGLLIAQREQYVGILTSGLKMSRLLATPEVRSGVSENAYLKSQYNYYLRASGFDTEFIPCAETWWQAIVLPLNGLVLSKWTIIATPAS